MAGIGEGGVVWGFGMRRIGVFAVESLPKPICNSTPHDISLRHPSLPGPNSCFANTSQV